MTATILKPIIEVKIDESLIEDLKDNWPPEVFIIKHSPSNRHIIHIAGQVHGLACFKHEHNIPPYLQKFRETNTVPPGFLVNVKVSFDEAREIAKSKMSQINSIVLCDDPLNPIIHYVR